MTCSILWMCVTYTLFFLSNNKILWQCLYGRSLSKILWYGQFDLNCPLVHKQIWAQTFMCVCRARQYGWDHYHNTIKDIFITPIHVIIWQVYSKSPTTMCTIPWAKLFVCVKQKLQELILLNCNYNLPRIIHLDNRNLYKYNIIRSYCYDMILLKGH